MQYSVFSAAWYREQKWYQGCGNEINEEHLERLETSGEFVAEPKRDGNWCIAFFDENGVEVRSRTGKLVKNHGLPNSTLLHGCALVGELARGTQRAVERRNELGYDFMDVWDCVASNYETNLVYRPDHERRATLVSLLTILRDDGEGAGVARHFKLLPRWRTKFRERYLREPEGLVIKHLSSDTSYIGGGEKVPYWSKLKKEFDVDLVIMGWEPSTSKTRIVEDERYVEHLFCGLYVNGELQEMAKVGGLKHDMSKRIAANFEKYRGRVIACRHSGQFKSGRFRHPRPDPSKIDPIRDDKDPRECVYRK